MPKLDWFPFYAQKLLTDDKWITMSPTERGFYIQLLAHQHVANGDGLPDDMWQLFLLSGAPGYFDENSPEWRDFLPTLKYLFPVCDDGRRRNPKLSQVAEEQEAKVAQRQHAGKVGAAARWGRGCGGEVA